MLRWAPDQRPNGSPVARIVQALPTQLGVTDLGCDNMRAKRFPAPWSGRPVVGLRTIPAPPRNKMALDYFALGLLFFVAVALFYGMIVLHDIPYEIAKSRNHPQQDAIHVAGWVSLFTLHAIWPFLWVWATLYREDRGWGFQQGLREANDDLAGVHAEMRALKQRIQTLEGVSEPSGAEATSTARGAPYTGASTKANPAAAFSETPQGEA